jgi:hypothetical protein
MARRIYKYELVPVPNQDLIGYHPEIHVQMPRGAEILHVDAQGDRMYVWAVVDPDGELARYTFIVVPTGGEVAWPIHPFIPHLGTVLMHGGSLVWHVFSDRQGRP